MYTAEEICKALNIDYSQVLNIFPYGSKVYGTATEDSDDDVVIVYKTSLLPSGAFKDNAISSSDKKIQGTCYSRSGFIDAINNYQITVLECIFLPEEKIIQKKMNFKLAKLDKKEMAKKIITTASASWHNAVLSHKDANIEFAKKNIFHALRILTFGLQIKEHSKIIDYSVMNDFKKQLYLTSHDFHVHDFFPKFIELSENLKK
jgi:predicted nucleotidyltransferase